MVTSREEKPLEAGSWRVASSASLRKPPSASMMASTSSALLSSECACESHISLWAFKSAQVISFSCISDDAGGDGVNDDDGGDGVNDDDDSGDSYVVNGYKVKKKGGCYLHNDT